MGGFCRWKAFLSGIERKLNIKKGRFANLQNDLSSR
jgi:hypothetical protein